MYTNEDPHLGLQPLSCNSRKSREKRAYHCVKGMLLKCIFHAQFICNDVDSMSEAATAVASLRMCCNGSLLVKTCGCYQAKNKIKTSSMGQAMAHQCPQIPIIKSASWQLFANAFFMSKSWQSARQMMSWGSTQHFLLIFSPALTFEMDACVALMK